MYTPVARFSMLDTPAVGVVSVPKRWASKTSRRELFEGVPFGIGNPLGCREIELGKRPRGVCDILCTQYAVCYDSIRTTFMCALVLDIEVINISIREAPKNR